MWAIDRLDALCRVAGQRTAALAALLAAGVMLQGCTTEASAESRQFANVVYDLPAGWQPNGKTEGRFQLRYAGDDERCDDCRILIDPGTAGSRPIQEWLAEMAAPGDRVEVVGDAEMRRDSIDSWPVESMLRQVEDRGRPKFQAYFAIDLPARNELIVFEGSARDEEAFNRSLAMLNTDVVALLNGLRFVSEGAEPVLGSPRRGDLQGPWFGTAIRNRYNGLSGALEMVVEERLMIFYADGRFFAGIPPSGAGPLDFAGLVAAGETRLGHYAVRGDTLELRYVDGDVSSARIPNGTSIDLGGVTIRPAAFPPDGFRFAGVIRRASYSALGAGVSGGVASDGAQVFHLDGTFTEESFTSVTGSFDSGGGFTTMSESPRQAGRYEVADGLITLMAPEGEPRSTWIIIEGESSVIVGGRPVFEPGDD